MRFYTLDGLRGVAALCIAVLHMPHFFPYLSKPVNAYLAVDFFFILSGFVLSFSYDRKISTDMTALRFFLIRATRLYPAYILGMILGITVAVTSLIFPGSALSITWTKQLLGCAIVSGIVMAPTPPCDGNTLIFPLNPVMWSVFFELIISIIFILTHRLLMRPTALLLIIFVSGIANFYVHYIGQNGFGDHLSHFWIGLLRVTFCFFLGVAIFRLQPCYQQRASIGITIGLCFILSTALLQPISGYLYSSIMVIVIFPAIITIGSRFNPPAGHVYIFITFGAISYVIYAIHKPAYQLLYGSLIKLFPQSPLWLMAIFGVILFILIIISCIIIERHFERPARNILGETWQRLMAPRKRTVDQAQI